jgi:hypothetical protein
MTNNYVPEDKRTRCVDSPNDQHGYECVLCGHRLGPNAAAAAEKLTRLRSRCHECRRESESDWQTASIAECMRCGELDCPHGEPLHYHHDGCPACTLESIPAAPATDARLMKIKADLGEAVLRWRDRTGGVALMKLIGDAIDQAAALSACCTEGRRDMTNHERAIIREWVAAVEESRQLELRASSVAALQREAYQRSESAAAALRGLAVDGPRTFLLPDGRVIEVEQHNSTKPRLSAARVEAVG